MNASAAQRPIFVENIYGPGFYAKERVLAAITPTVSFDLDQTVASIRGGSRFILRPGIGILSDLSSTVGMNDLLKTRLPTNANTHDVWRSKQDAVYLSRRAVASAMTASAAA